MMHIWNWDGKYFGHLTNGNLITYSGKHIGKYIDGEIYDSKGKYIGEIMNNNRLIVNTHNKRKTSHAFTPLARTAGYAKYADDAGNVMYAGYENFPHPDKF